MWQPSIVTGRDIFTEFNLIFVVTGGQCPDPGHPVDGYVTFSSYLHGNDLVYTVEEGSVATFHCNREVTLTEFNLNFVVTGGQCPDPGHPVDGYVTFSSYLHGNDLVYTVEEGSVATFHCNREGYEPTPHNTIECVVFDDGGPGWSDSVPVCRGWFLPMKLLMAVNAHSQINFQMNVAF